MRVRLTNISTTPVRVGIFRPKDPIANGYRTIIEIGCLGIVDNEEAADAEFDVLDGRHKDVRIDKWR